MLDLANPKHYKKNQRPASNGKYETTYKIIGIILVCFFTGFGLLIQSINYTTQENRVRELIVQKRNLEIEIMPYIIKENNMVRLSDVEDYARKTLKMDFPSDSKSKKILVGTEE